MKYKFTSILIIFLILTQIIQPIVLNGVSYATTTEETQEKVVEITQEETQEEVDKPTQEETIQQETIDSFSEMLNSNKDEIESISVNLGFTSEGVPEIKGDITINQMVKTDIDEQQENSEEELVGASIGSTTSVKIVEKPEAASIEKVFRIFKALDKKINLRIH